MSNRLRIAFAVTLMLSLFVGLHAYVAQRLISAPGFSPALSAVVWGGFASIFGAFIGSRLVPRPLSTWLQWVGFSWMGSFGVLLTATLASDVLLAVASLFTPVTQDVLVLRSAVVGGLALIALISGFFIARAPEVKQVEVRIPNLDPALDGVRIAQLTDVHLGDTLGKRFAQRIVAQTNALNPDVIALTGDIIEGTVHKIRDDVAPLADLRAKLGVFYVTGNHEYYHGAPAWEAEMARLGLTVLHNQHRVVTVNGATLVVGGVTDVEGARFAVADKPSTKLTFEGAPNATRVLLAHQPRFAPQAKGHGVSLMLSGHTHGGQIFPFMYFVKLQQPVVAGLHVIDDVLTYTSKGTGYWGPPFRVGARGEIALLTLRRA